MPANNSTSGDYNSLKSLGKKKPVDEKGGPASLRSKKKTIEESVGEAGLSRFSRSGKPGPEREDGIKKLPEEGAFALRPKNEAAKDDSDVCAPAGNVGFDEEMAGAASNVEEQKILKQAKRADKDRDILNRDDWVTRNGHYLTYIGLYCFSILVLYRPYELIPQLGFLSATAFYAAAATLAVFIPTQLATEGSLTFLSFEVKMVILLTCVALISIPIAKSPGVAWEEFNDIFIKAVLMFVVMVNVLRTKKRLMGMIWLSLGIALILSVMALNLYMRGEMDVEGYRVAVDVGGMFGNPNDLALHLVMMTPLAIVFGVAAKNKIKKIAYFAVAAILVAGIMVTYSRGAFLGLVCVSIFLIWKLGRENRVKVLALAAVIAAVVMALAPGNYGQRLLSIFIPGFDVVGSSDQRRELLIQSIIVSIRNPWGIGIGNFPIVGARNLVTHNSFTQVSSELGVLGLAAYLGFLIAPFRRLGNIERGLRSDGTNNWYYYVAVGLQAGILGYMVSSFFVAVAYGWFAYYLIAYAVAFRRIYTLEHHDENETSPRSVGYEVNGFRT